MGKGKVFIEQTLYYCYPWQKKLKRFGLQRVLRYHVWLADDKILYMCSIFSLQLSLFLPNRISFMNNVNTNIYCIFQFHFTKELEDQHIKEKENGIFTCAVTHKRIPVDWFMNDEKVIPGPKYQVYRIILKHFFSVYSLSESIHFYKSRQLWIPMNLRNYRFP